MVSDFSLVGFCHLALNVDNRRFAANPVKLGRLFRQYAVIERTPNLRNTVGMVRSLGIVIEEVDCLSTHGANMLDKDKVWHIIYSAKDSPATQKFTIYHELFEIIQKSFADMAPSYHRHDEYQLSRITKQSAEHSADRFAGAVLLSPQFLVKHLISTGCDLAKLAAGLELSHQCLLVSMEQHLAGIPFVGALFDCQLPDGIRSRQKAYDYVATMVVKTSSAWPIQEVCHWQTDPVLDERPQGGSLVCAALQGSCPVFYHDPGEENSAAILVRPLFSGARRPLRVIFLALPATKSDRFYPQVDSIQAVVVDKNSPCPSVYKCRNPQNCRWKR